jgi:H/ACA ribonucleoprotein complex subunit 3
MQWTLLYFMTSHLLKCPSCGSYALSVDCSCGGKRVSPNPPKYSPEDKYGQYRRRAKEGLGKENGFDSNKDKPKNAKQDEVGDNGSDDLSDESSAEISDEISDEFEGSTKR